MTRWPDDDETFCLYCQREYASPKRLRTHVLAKHPNTYRADAYSATEHGGYVLDER